MAIETVDLPQYGEDPPSYTSSSSSPVAIKEGGKRGWLVVLGAFLNFCSGFGFLNAFGTYQDYYTRKGILTTVEMGWIASTQFGLLLASGIFVGPLYDRWGARRLIIPGCIITLASLLISAFRYDFASLMFSLGILLGIGNAMIFHPAISAITGWFDRQRALALGTAVAGASVGGIYWPIITDALLRSFERGTTENTRSEHALKLTFIITLTIFLPLMSASCCLVTENGSIGRHDDHDQTEKDSPILSLEFGHTFTHCLTRLQIAFAVALFFVWIGAIIPFGFIPLVATQFVGGSWPNYLLTICYSSSFVGRLLLTWLSDKAGLMNNLSSLVAFSIAYGFCSGSLIPVGTACISQLSSDVRHTGLRQGIIMCFCAIGITASGPITGYLFQDFKAWHAMEWFTGATTVFGGFLLVIVRIWAKPMLWTAF
ncbi:MFS general substrate transporter [Sarocladium strictum]